MMMIMNAKLNKKPITLHYNSFVLLVFAPSHCNKREYTSFSKIIISSSKCKSESEQLSMIARGGQRKIWNVIDYINRSTIIKLFT